MIDIKEARKELKKIGHGKAEGDALRFMYANLIALLAHLSVKSNSIQWPIPEIYAELGKVSDKDISEKAREMMRNPNLSRENFIWSCQK